MTKLVQSKNAGLGRKFRNIFKPRDIFFHDGTSLRRIRVSGSLQFGFAFALGITLFWSVFAAAQLAASAAAPSYADVARMERQVASMQADVAAIKQVAHHRYSLTATEIRRLGIDPTRLQSQGYGMERPIVPNTSDQNRALNRRVQFIRIEGSAP